MTAPPQKLGYRPELDGVRAMAVLLVLLYHLTFLDPSLTHVGRGGFIGVDLFFVLSGLLITEILMADVDRIGRSDLLGFYRRRARRLLPALFVFIGLALAWYQLVHGNGRSEAHGLLHVLTYTLYGRPASTPFPPGVSQVWTLVVEWEFYIAWSIALVGMLLLRIPRPVIGVLALVGVAACSVARIVMLHHEHYDLNGLVLNYHLGLLRLQDMLVGCAIALLPAARRIPRSVRTAAVIAVVVVTVRANYVAPWLYQYGLLLIALATGAMVAPRHKAWWADKFLASRPIVWIGVISYSLYLWSGFAVSQIGGHTRSWPMAPRILVVLLASVALASLSYYQVERRFRARSRRAEPGGVRLLGEPDAGATAAP